MRQLWWSISMVGWGGSSIDEIVMMKIEMAGWMGSSSIDEIVMMNYWYGWWWWFFYRWDSYDDVLIGLVGLVILFVVMW